MSWSLACCSRGAAGAALDKPGPGTRAPTTWQLYDAAMHDFVDGPRGARSSTKAPGATGYQFAGIGMQPSDLPIGGIGILSFLDGAGAAPSLEFNLAFSAEKFCDDYLPPPSTSSLSSAPTRSPGPFDCFESEIHGAFSATTGVKRSATSMASGGATVPATGTGVDIAASASFSITYATSGAGFAIIEGLNVETSGLKNPMVAARTFCNAWNLCAGPLNTVPATHAQGREITSELRKQAQARGGTIAMVIATKVVKGNGFALASASESGSKDRSFQLNVDVVGGRFGDVNTGASQASTSSSDAFTRHDLNGKVIAAKFYRFESELAERVEAPAPDQIVPDADAPSRLTPVGLVDDAFVSQELRRIGCLV